MKHTAPADNDAAVDTDNQGVAESGELTLSRYGGDKFKVLAYALEAPPVGENKPAKNLSKDYDGVAKTTTETLDGFSMEMETKDAWLK